MADPILIGIPEIASIAGVTRPAVSNWRKRYADFPEPRVQSDTGVLFELSDVEAFLLERGKIDAPIAPGALVWRFAEALRGEWSAGDLFEFISSWICYLEACRRAEAADGATAGHGPAPRVPPEYRWDEVSESSDKKLAARLRAVAAGLAELNPAIADVFVALAPDPFPSISSVRSLVAELAAALDLRPASALFSEAQTRTVEIARSYGESSTPPELSELISYLGWPVPADDSVTFDPACGTGGTLAWNALSANIFEPKPERSFIGFDVSAAAVRHAQARFFLAGWNADIRQRNSLHLAPDQIPKADLVVVDPPFGVKNWGDPDIYRSSTWTYGTPPPSSADMAWVELALAALKTNGRAVVVLPVGSCTAGGREAAIREALLQAGVVEAVVHTPPRLKPNTSIPLAIWVLRTPCDAPPPVLLVDASQLGAATRTTTELHEDELHQIIHAVKIWRETGTVVTTEALPAVAVEIEDLVANRCDLSPRRYVAVTSPVDTTAKSGEAAEAHSRAVDAAIAITASLNRVFPELPDELHGRSQTRRLGEVAAITRSRMKAVEEPFITQDGDIVLSTVDGEVHVARPQPGTELHGSHLVILRSMDGELEPTWLELWLRTETFAELLQRYQTGATIRSVSAEDLANFELKVPPLEVQRHAAEVLLDHDVAIRAARTLLEALEQQRQADIDLAYARVTQ